MINGECQRGPEELRHLLSHVNPAMEYGELLQRLVADGLAKYDPARRPARVRRAKSGSATPPPADGMGEGDSAGASTDGRSSNSHPTPGTERSPHHAAPAAEIDHGRTWAPKLDDPQPSSGRHGSVPQPKPAGAPPAEPTSSESPRPGAPPGRSSEPRPSPGQGGAATAAPDSETAATHRDRAKFAPAPGTADRVLYAGALPAGPAEHDPHQAAAPTGSAHCGPDHGASRTGKVVACR